MFFENLLVCFSYLIGFNILFHFLLVQTLYRDNLQYVSSYLSFEM